MLIINIIIGQVKKMTGQKKWTVVVGFGNRGQVYADYANQEPEELGIAAIVDPNEFKRQEAKKRYNLEDKQLFKNFGDFLASGIACDFIINATMDQYHYDTALEIIDAGYDMLMEKPIVPNEKQLRDIEAHAKAKNTRVFVCHVLRYTPFYSKVKELLNADTIGEIMTVEMNEHVCMAHYLTAFDRGKWNSESKCGSGFLLAKTCHDFDLMCWLNNASAPKQVASFGSRNQFVAKKVPEGAAEYCYQCKYEPECQYSAKNLYLENDAMPFLVWAELNKPLDEITMEEKEEFLKHNIYGKCGYTCGGDLVDRQSTIVNFENGSVGTFNLVAGSTRAGRFLHIVGSKGEIEGVLEKNSFILRKPSRNNFDGTEEIIEVHPINKAEHGGHNGGDYMIMHDLVRYLNGDASSVSITNLEDSINGHLCIYAAEESRKSGKIIQL